MANRKDDPVFNIKFIEYIESKPCLWNSTLPTYSRKDEIQKAWQEVANETKDTVRNCRERWRTIRSSFLRSLKLSVNSSERKRKYYLAKYLQFLIPYTRTRQSGVIKASDTINTTKLNKRGVSPIRIPPITSISNMPMPLNGSEETKDSSSNSNCNSNDDDDLTLGVQEDVLMACISRPSSSIQRLNPLNIKQETNEQILPQKTPSHHLTRPLEVVGYASPLAANCKASNDGNDVESKPAFTATGSPASLQLNGNFPNHNTCKTTNLGDLNFLTDLIKGKIPQHLHSASSALNHNNILPGMHLTQLPDAEQSFLNSLYPFLKEMTGKQNRRFRQKVIALIDAILDNTD